MKKEKNIIQFLPYSTPHIWGVENVWEEIFRKWTYWKSSIFSWCLSQELDVNNKNWPKEDIKKWQEKKIFFPDFEIIDNFPVPKIWTRLFWKKWKELQKSLKTEEENYVISHTRFFLSSVLAWVFAKKNNCRWIHIEHGSGYVKLSSSWKSKIAYFYDRTIWKQVLKNADTVLCISKSSKGFVSKEFWVQGVKVWLRGIDIPEVGQKYGSERVFVFIWRLVHLKWVEILLRAYSRVSSKLELVIIWDGEEKEKLIHLTQELWISENTKFLWHMGGDEVLSYLSVKSCILINPSYQEWMPTTVIEGLMTQNIVVATDVWGTREISSKKDLILTGAWNINMLKEKLEYAEKNFEKLVWMSYNHVRKNFSWEKSLEDFYNNL